MCIYIMYKTHIAYIIANGVQTDKKKTVWSLKQKKSEGFRGMKGKLCVEDVQNVLWGGQGKGEKKGVRS